MDYKIDPNAVKQWFEDNNTSYETVMSQGLLDAFNDDMGFLLFDDIGDGFLISTTALSVHSWSFDVYEVSSWSCDDNGDYSVPCEMEKYLHGSIKWDGCSHFWFGDEDGYIHICGADYLKKHTDLMTVIYTKAESMIETFDPSEKLENN